MSFFVCGAVFALLVELVVAGPGALGLGNKHVLPVASFNHHKSTPVVPVKDTPPMYDYQAPNVVCPRGYVLDGQDCARQESASPDMACARGYTMQNGSCFKPVFLQTQQICPKGMQQTQSGQCTKVETASPDEFCPTGFVRNGLECLQTVSADVIPNCLHGYSLMGDYCLMEEAPTIPDIPPQCEEGAILKPDGTCAFRRKDTNPPSPVCPPNYHYQKGYCVLFQRPNYECEDEGYTLNPNNNMCERDYEELARDISPDAEPFCQPGSTLNPQTQKCEIQQRPKYSCPPGFVNSGSNCVKKNVADLKKECPAGYKFSSSGERCERTMSASPDAICSPPSQLINNQCVDYEQDAPFPVCPSGFVLSGRICERTETTNPVLECNAGYQMANNQCVRPIVQKSRPPPPPAPQTKKGYFHL